MLSYVLPYWANSNLNEVYEEGAYMEEIINPAPSVPWPQCEPGDPNRTILCRVIPFQTFKRLQWTRVLICLEWHCEDAIYLEENVL